MQIAQIELFYLEQEWTRVYTLSAGRTYSTFGSSIVRVTADDGTIGWGESAPFGSTYVAAHPHGTQAGIIEIAPHLLGRDPRQVDRIGDAMDAALVGHNDAKAALDVACWDLFGSSVGLPVSELLGGATTHPMRTISSIHVAAPEKMRADVAEHREQGYLSHSIKIGALESEGGPALDAERIRACLAERRPGELFVVDANGGLTPAAVLRTIALLPPGIDIILEAPCSTWRETMSLRARCPFPIVVDELAQSEEDLALVIARDVADGFSLKVSKNGGLTMSRRQRDIARSVGLTASVQDSVGSEIAYSAVLHLASSFQERLLDGVYNPTLWNKVRVGSFEPVHRDGGVLPPSAPGLGVDVDEAVLGSPVRTWN